MIPKKAMRMFAQRRWWQIDDNHDNNFTVWWWGDFCIGQRMTEWWWSWWRWCHNDGDNDDNVHDHDDSHKIMMTVTMPRWWWAFCSERMRLWQLNLSSTDRDRLDLCLSSSPGWPRWQRGWWPWWQWGWPAWWWDLIMTRFNAEIDAFDDDLTLLKQRWYFSHHPHMPTIVMTTRPPAECLIAHPPFHGTLFH